MGVLQVSYLGLFMFDVYYPMIDSIYPLKYTQGYGDLLPKSTSNLPITISRAGMDKYICNNLNLMLLLVVIPLLTSIVLFIISKVQRKNKSSN